MEDVFSIPSFVQFNVSATVLCITAFQLTIVSFSKKKSF